MFHLQQPTQTYHQFGRGALISEQVPRDDHSAEEDNELTSNVFGSSFALGDGLKIPSSIVHYHQEVLMAMGGLQEQPYQIHTRPLERDPDGEAAE